MSGRGRDIAPRVHPAFTRWDEGSRGSQGGVLDFWKEELNKDPELRQAVFCLEAVFGGDVVVRLATDEIKTTSGTTGKAYHWQGGLIAEPEIDHSYTLGSGQSVARSFPFTISNALIDAASIIARGRTLAGFGELSLQVDGMDYDKRLVLMRGDMDDGVSFGTGDSGQVAFSLTDPKGHADVNVTQWTISAQRLDNSFVTGIPDAAAGSRYPLVINRYTVPSIDVEQLSSIRRFLVAYGHNHTVNALWVNGELRDTLDQEWGVEKFEYFDNFGVPVTVVKATGYHSWDNSETVHIDITSGFDQPTLFESMEWFLKSFTTLGNAGINQELFGLAEARMGASEVRIMINGSGEDTAAKAIQYIENELLRGFPMVSMAWSMGGYGPIVTDHRSKLRRANLTADLYPLKDRVSDPQETPKSQLYNNFTFRYDYDIIDDQYSSVILRNPANNDICGISLDNAGERHKEPIEVQQVFDDAVAEYTAGWMVSHLALPSYYLEYNAYPWIFLYLQLGDVVLLTESDFGWTEEVATVERIVYARGNCTVGLRVWSPYYKLGGAASGQAMAQG